MLGLRCLLTTPSSPVQSRGLLQQYFIPGYSHSASSSSVGAERCGAPGCQEEEMSQCDSITPAIRDNLYWLLVQRCVDVCIVYKCLYHMSLRS